MQGIPTRYGLVLSGFVILILLPADHCCAETPAFRAKGWAPESILPWSRLPHVSWTGGVGGELYGESVLRGLGFSAVTNSGPWPTAYTDGYSVRYPWLHQGDYIPLFGQLYRTGPVHTDKRTCRFTSVMRVAHQEIPKGVHVRPGTYLFPLRDHTTNGLYFSGTLHKCYIYVWNIELSPDKSNVLRARVGTLADVNKYNNPRRYDDKIQWQWVHVGDKVYVGDERHEVLSIVATKEPPGLKRGKARMIGWIELSSKPADDAASENTVKLSKRPS